MKKIISIIMICGLLGVLAGCGQSQQEVVDNTAGTNTGDASETTDANSGNTAAGEISAEEAKAIALEKVSGASEADLVEFKQDTDDGRLEYEGKIIYNDKEYDFEIDAGNGNVISWEEEPVER